MSNSKITALIISLFLLIGLTTIHESKSQMPPAESITDSPLIEPTSIEEPTTEDDPTTAGKSFCTVNTTEDIEVTCPDDTKQTVTSDKDCNQNDCKVSCGPYEEIATVDCNGPLEVQINKCKCKGGKPPTTGYCTVLESEFKEVTCPSGAKTKVINHKTCSEHNKCKNCGPWPPKPNELTICGKDLAAIVKRCYCKT